MKHVVIFAHPNAQSFTGSVAEVYANAVRALGHTVIMRDLYRIGFDPCLKPSEIPSDKVFGPAPDVVAERALLKDAEVFALVYPLWLYAPPAIMKGYMERVFGFGFAYGAEGHSYNPLLSGRKLISFSSSGSPFAWVQKTGNKEKATAFMQKLKEHLDAMNFAEAEKTADAILVMMGVSTPATAGTSAPSATQDITEEVREKLAHNLGSSFLLFRTKVQGELKVTREQKEKLDQYLQKLLPDAMRVLQKSNGERQKYNQKTHEERAAVLKEILNEGQRTRLHQLELQKDGLFGPAWNRKELQITDEQQKQFMAPTQKTYQKTQALMEEIHKGANPDEIRPKVLQLRLDLEAQLETLLTDAQEKQWKEMLGKPVELGVLFDGVSSR